MNILKNKIFKNFFYLTASNLIAKIIGFLTNVIIVRTIDVDEYGLYRWYSVIIGYLILLINFGFDVYFYKLILSKNFSFEKVLALQIKSRLIFGGIIYFITILISNYLIYNFDSKILFLILSSQILIYVINIEIFIKIKEFFSFLSLLIFIKALLTLLLVYIFIKDERDIIKLAVIIVVINLTSNIISWYFLKNKVNIDIRKFFNFLKNLKLTYIFFHLKKSIVINLSFFMISVYYNLDSLMLGFFKTNTDVAVYSVAYAFILMAIMPTRILYSVFSSKLSKNIYSKKIFKEYVFSTVILGVVVFIFLLLTYKYLILFAYGKKYFSAVEVLFYLSFNIIPCYLAGAFANPINLWGDYKKYLLIVSIGAIGNFIGNLIFIPLYGINGAIFTTILSEVLVFFSAFIYWIKHKELLK